MYTEGIPGEFLWNAGVYLDGEQNHYLEVIPPVESAALLI